MQDAMDYLTWTFFYRRLLQNPSYYDLEATDPESVNEFLSRMVIIAPGYVLLRICCRRFESKLGYTRLKGKAVACWQSIDGPA